MTLALLAALGGAVGAPLRYLIDLAVRARFGADFPWGTLTVNLGGSFLLGTLLGLPLSTGPQVLLGTGLCGALTTYSTFSHDTLRLAREGSPRRATANVALSLGAGLLAGYAGAAVATLLGGPA